MDPNRVRTFASSDTQLQTHFQNSVQTRSLDLAATENDCKLTSIPDSGQFVQFYSQPQELIEYLSGDFIDKFLAEFGNDIQNIHPLIGLLGPENAVKSALTSQQISEFLGEFNAQQIALLRQSCMSGDFSAFQPSAWDQFISYILKLLPTSKGQTTEQKIIQEFQQSVGSFLTRDGMCYREDIVILPVAVKRCLNSISTLEKELQNICVRYGYSCQISLEEHLKDNQWSTYVPLLTNLGEKIFPEKVLQKGLQKGPTSSNSACWILGILVILVVIFLIVKSKRRN